MSPVSNNIICPQRTGLLLRQCIGFLVTSLFFASCLSDDLPDPTQCPKAAAIMPDDSCPPVAQGCDQANPGFACNVRPMAACTCADSECPPDPDGCYLHGECPEFALEEFMGRAPRCLRPAAMAAKPVSQDCVCGCSRCVSTCDGFGPLLRARNQGSENMDLLSVDLPELSPENEVMVYARARGQGKALIRFGTADVELRLRDISSRAAQSPLFLETATGKASGQFPKNLTVSVPPGERASLELDCILFVVQ